MCVLQSMFTIRYNQPQTLINAHAHIVIFNVFDIDRNGEISREEFKKILSSIMHNKMAQSLMAVPIQQGEMEKDVDTIVHEFFEEADVDKNGTISFEVGVVMCAGV